MFGQIIAVKLYVFGSVLVFGGLVAQLKSYSRAGMKAILVGYILTTLIMFRHLVVLFLDLFLGEIYIDRAVTEVASSVILTFGSCLCYVAGYSFANMDRVYVAVSLVGCLLMSVGGVATLLNE